MLEGGAESDDVVMDTATGATAVAAADEDCRFVLRCSPRSVTVVNMLGGRVLLLALLLVVRQADVLCMEWCAASVGSLLEEVVPLPGGG